MCGLVGIAGKLTYQDEATMKRLLVLDSFRGMDSTGLAAVRTANGDSFISKIASHPFDLFDTKSFDKVLLASSSSVFLGHNRAATVGKVVGANAHPFQSGSIVGAHNGTLEFNCWTDLEKSIGEQTGTDSQAIFIGIDKLGVEEVITNLEEGSTPARGAWALTWVDTENMTINFLRNKHRPLWFAFDKTCNRIIWASEWEMIQAATAMSASDYDLYDDEEGYNFFPVPDDMWLRFSLKDLRENTTGVPIKPTIKTVKGKEPKPVVSYSGGAAPFASTTTTSTTTSTTSDTTGVSNVVNLYGDRLQPFAGAVTPERFKHIAKYGCSWCGTDVSYEEVGVVVLDYEEVVLCPGCAGGKKDHNRVYLPEGKLKDVVAN